MVDTLANYSGIQNLHGSKTKYVIQSKQLKMSKIILIGVDFILKINNIKKGKKMSNYFIRVSQSWPTQYHL